MSKEKKRLAVYRKNLRNQAELLRVSDSVSAQHMLTPSGVSEYVLAPLVLDYSLWIIQSAINDGIDQLYFLSRDGYVPYRAVSFLCREMHIHLSCRYFYCSRYALRVPMYSQNIDEALEYICRSGIDVTLKKILIRSGFSTDELPQLKKLFPEEDFDAIIPYSELGLLRKRLRADEKFIRLIAQRSDEMWPSLRGYFSQEGMLDDQWKTGIVDSGWTGSMQKTIMDIRRRCGCKKNIYGYYFGLFETQDENSPEYRRCYYFGPDGQIRDKSFFSNSLIECLFSAEQGTCTGYKNSDHHVEPVLKTWEKTPFKIKLLELYSSYVRTWAEQHKGHSALPRNQILKSLRIFMTRPTEEEAAAYGSLPFSDDLMDDHLNEVAPVFTERQLSDNHIGSRLLAVSGLRKTAIHESAWFEASIVRSEKNHLARGYHRLSYMAYKILSRLRKML